MKYVTLLGLGLLLASGLWWVRRLLRGPTGGLPAEGRMAVELAACLGLCYVLIAIVGNPIDYYAPFAQYVFYYLALGTTVRSKQVEESRR